MKFILGKKIIIFYFLVAVSLASVLAFFYYTTQKVKSASYLVGRTQEVLRTSDNVLLDFLSIETSASGYVLTGSEIFSEPINKSITALNSNLRLLAAYTKENAQQQVRINLLRDQSEERLVLIKSLIDARKLNSLDEAGKISIIEQGKILTGKIRNTVDEINSDEIRLLNQQKIAVEKNNKNSEIVFLLLLIFIIIIFVLVNYILKNQKIRNNELEEFTASQKLLSNYSLSLIEASLDPLITLNTDGKITDMNEALANITGITREKLKGTDFFDYFTDPQMAREVYQEVFAKGSAADSPLTLRHKNGKLTDVLFNGSVYKDDHGNILGIVIVARDVTAQKLLSKYSLSLIEASLDPLITINTEGKITDMNEALANITGMTRAELTCTDFFDYFTEPQMAREVYQEVFAKGSVADSPLTLRHKDGKLTDVLFNGSVYKDDRGNVLGAVVVARDIAEQKWATELRIVNKELAFQNQEKEKRAAELGIANEELAFQNQEKENRAAELFIANKELVFQNDEKGKRADELSIANDELAFQNNEKGKRADELFIANNELAYQNKEKENRAAELVLANEELAYQNEEKEKRAAELFIANKELVFQNEEKEKRAAELFIANKELVFQNKEKEKRAAELFIANKELVFQNEEKEKRAAELILANKELLFQNEEKEKRAAELVISDNELIYQTKEKEKQEIANVELEAISDSLKLASQYARSLIEASLDPLFTISPEGKITDINKASVNITGMAYGKLIGTDFFDYFTDPQKAREVYQEVFANGFVTDYPLTIRDGKLTDVLLNGSVYTDDLGNVLGVVVVARDITDQKRIETELIEAKVFAELATIIAEEAKIKAESATLTAENAVKAKQQFLSNMSHEIRTPMNAIIGFTKVVLKTELSTKQKEYLTAIKISGDALIVLINDILDLAKVDAGKMVFRQTPFKMALSLSAMLHLFETKIQEKNLVLAKEYDPSIPEVLVGDPVRLHQVILNLVSNAVKFTAKGKITVSVRLLKEDEESVSIEFSVKDTGIGISDDKIGKIFENFQQASSGTSRLYGGTGLGLAIVKQLVEPQGGTISVKSVIGEGSTFSFILGFLKTNSDAEIETDPDINREDSEIKNIKVLVAEDIPLNQLLMRTLLDDFGFEREIAANGKIAIEKLQAGSFDIILMDLQMPEMNGFETTDYIRNTMHSKIPIIALTADVTTVDLAKCRAVGMNDYIAKPVDERLLYNKIVGLVKKPSAMKTNATQTGEASECKKTKCTDLEYLTRRTKSNPVLMAEMISAYLEQTPPLIRAMKKSFYDKNWSLLYSAVHKMIPSFSIMGISPDFENMAKKIQEFARTQNQTDGIEEMVIQLENVCNQACKELEEELIELIELKENTHE